MNIADALSNNTLSATATPTRAGYTDTITITSGGQTTYADADQAYRTFFVLAGTTTAASLALTTGDASGDAWTAPVRQVETATAAGTVTTPGDATVTITASGLTGSPLAVTVAVEFNDTATLVAGKIRAALVSTDDVAAMFDISGTTTDIILTRRPLASYTLGTEIIDTAYANDGTLNIAIANDTSAGITAAPTSTNTTTAVVADGAYIVNDDVDFEGIALASPTAIYAVNIEHLTDDDNGQTVDYTIGTEYSGRLASTTTQSSRVLLSYPDAASILDTLSMTGTSDTGLMAITVVGKE